jgi:SPP1 family predicted phage head-tail adaptor
MKIGQLNRRITVEQPSNIKDQYGGVTSNYAAIGSYWAYVKPVSNKALFLQGQNIERNTYEIYLRYVQIPNGSLVSYEGRKMTIIGEPQELSEGNRRFIKLIASENG